MFGFRFRQPRLSSRTPPGRHFDRAQRPPRVISTGAAKPRSGEIFPARRHGPSTAVERFLHSAVLRTAPVEMTGEERRGNVMFCHGRLQLDARHAFRRGLERSCRLAPAILPPCRANEQAFVHILFSKRMSSVIVRSTGSDGSRNNALPPCAGRDGDPGVAKASLSGRQSGFLRRTPAPQIPESYRSFSTLRVSSHIDRSYHEIHLNIFQGIQFVDRVFPSK